MKPVVNSFRSELRGINTYRWQAWNDAAIWCLRHNTNLEEALEWAERSIRGGFNGFASNKNVTNLLTKAQLEAKLNSDELSKTISEISDLELSSGDVNEFTIFLLTIRRPEPALRVLNEAIKKYPDTWFLRLNRGLSYYFVDNKPKALKELRTAKEKTPEFFQERMAQIIKEVEDGTYKIPGT